MNSENMVQVNDRDGWRKEFPLQKPLIHIGSDARNDIVLELGRGSGVAPRHLQLVITRGDTPGYRAINLGDTEVQFGVSGERSLSPRDAGMIVDGEHLRIGEFTLIFRLGAAGVQTFPAAATRPAVSAGPVVAGFPTGLTVEEASAAIGLRLSFPQRVVVPDNPLEGVVCVHNRGKEPGVQFKLEVEGLPPDYYEIGPGPILFPNVEKGVFLRIHHPRGPDLPAGRREIRVRASAPQAYPGESVTISRDIEFLPYYHHELHLVAVD